MLNFQASGEGPPLILLHGLFGSLENLGTLAKALGASNRIYSLDLPEHGRSGHKDSTSVPLMAASILKWMDDQKLEQPHKSEITDNPGRSTPTRPKTWATGFRKRSPMEVLLFYFCSQYGLLSSAPLAPNLSREDDGYKWRMNLDVLEACYPVLIQANSQGQFDGQVLFLKGGQSNYIREIHRGDTLARFPNAQVKEIADTGHWLHAEKPDLVASTIQKFLSSK